MVTMVNRKLSFLPKDSVSAERGLSADMPKGDFKTEGLSADISARNLPIECRKALSCDH